MKSFCILFLCVTAAVAQMTPTTRQQILDEHNRVRRTVNSPKMLKMKYEMKLECLAQRYIETQSASSFQHNPTASTWYTTYCGGPQNPGFVGENWYSGGPGLDDAYADGATNAWCDFRWGSNKCSERMAYYNQCTEEVGHFTQVVWETTEYVGCGYAAAGTLCNYWKGGNYRGVAPFSVGTPCGSCPSTHPYCDAGLCSSVDIDRCAMNQSNCDTNSLCTPTNGSFICTCVLGYTGTGQECHRVVATDAASSEQVGDSAIAAAVLLPLSVILFAVLLYLFSGAVCAMAFCVSVKNIFPTDIKKLAFIAAGMHFIPFILSLIAVGTMEWMTAPSVQIGLFRYCVDSFCDDAQNISNSGGGMVQAVQAFVIMVIISYATAIGLTLFLGYNTSQNKIYPFIAFNIVGLALVETWCGLIVYAAYKRDVVNSDGVSFSWSFILFALAWVMAMPSLLIAYHFMYQYREQGSYTKTSSTAMPMSPSATHTVGSPPTSPTTTREGDWEKMWDDNQKSHYYYNHKTGVSSWDKPDGVRM